MRSLRVTGLLSGVAVATLTSLVSAQERPDFSGVWTSAPGTAATEQGARSTGPVGSGWGWTFTITQDAAGLTVVQPFYTRADLQPPLTFRYALDGSEGVNTLLMGRGVQLQRSTTTWDGGKLVITTVSEFESPEDGRTMTSEVEHTLWLVPAPLPAWPPTLVVEVIRSGALGGNPSTTRTVYTRSP